MIRTALGGIFPEGAEEAVRAALAARSAIGQRPAILDVGSGAGSWYSAFSADAALRSGYSFLAQDCRGCANVP